jgi:hypothetical protein
MRLADRVQVLPPRERFCDQSTIDVSLTSRGDGNVILLHLLHSIEMVSPYSARFKIFQRKLLKL